MSAILWSYIPLLLLFTISFSSQFDHNEIELVPLVSQPTSLKLYGFFIYPSNDQFKHYILPFLSSEILLKIYYHFRNLYPNVSIQKFLPHSTVTRSVLNFEHSYVAYIFEDEFCFFNPIVCDSEQNYKTVTLGSRHNSTEEDLIYALFSSNKIFSLESHVLTNYQKVFAAFDETDDSFFVAAPVKKEEEKLIAIAHGTIPSWGIDIEFLNYLDCVLEAHELNCLKKFYFKCFDWNFKYANIFNQSRWKVFVMDIFNRDCPWTLFPAKIFYQIPRFAFYYIGSFPLYHAEMFPFYLLSFPVLFFLFQHNLVFSEIIAKNFVYFWTIPTSFIFMFFWFYSKVYIIILDKDRHLIQIKPQEISMPVTYLIRTKHDEKFLPPCGRTLLLMIVFLELFFLGFINTLPFAPFMMIHQEANE